MPRKSKKFLARSRAAIKGAQTRARNRRRAERAAKRLFKKRSEAAKKGAATRRLHQMIDEQSLTGDMWEVEIGMAYKAEA